MNRLAEILWNAGLITTEQVEEAHAWRGDDVEVGEPAAGAALDLALLGPALDDATSPRQTSFDATTLPALGVLTLRWPNADIPEQVSELEYVVETDGTVVIGCADDTDVDAYRAIIANGLSDLDGIFFSDVLPRHTDDTLTHLACTPCRSPT